MKTTLGTYAGIALGDFVTVTQGVAHGGETGIVEEISTNDETAHGWFLVKFPADTDRGLKERTHLYTEQELKK